MKNTVKNPPFLLEYKESLIDEELVLENHCHSQYELLAVYEGEINIIFEGKSFELKSGCCALVSPLAYHAITVSKKGLYSRATYLFDSTLIPNTLRRHFDNWNKGISIVEIDSMDIFRKASKSDDTKYYAPLLESIIVQILYKIVSKGETEQPNDIDSELSKMIAFVDEHLCDTIRLADIANHVALSVSSVSHIFTEKMKTSPKQYILQKRLALASKLIHEGAPATEAAFKIGYDSYSDFYRMYKKHFGKSPMSK